MLYIFVAYLSFFGIYLSQRYSQLNNGRLCLEKFTYLVVGFFYIIIPVFYLTSFDNLKENSYNFWVLKTDDDFESLSYAMLIYLLAMTSLISGIVIGKKIKVENIILNSVLLNRFSYFCCAMGVISILVTLLYIYKVGGIVQAIVDANLYRAHGLKEPPIGQLAKLQPIIINASLLVLAMKIRFRYAFITAAFLYLFIEASRTNLGLYLIVIYLFKINFDNNFKLFKLIFPVFIAVFMAYLGNSITDYIETGVWSLNNGLFYSVISQFSPTFSNVMNSYNFVEQYGFGYLEDALSIFPQVMFGFEKTTKTWELLTEYYLGGFYTVGIPIDLLSYSYSQFGFVGALLMPFFFGIIIGFLSKKMNNIISSTKEGTKERALAIMIELILAMFIMALINWASLDSTVFYGSIKYWIFIVVFFLLIRIKGHNEYIAR
ncbi:hypothetical protein L1D11_10950 [Vibrio sp. Isolate32]|uniref:hypothetical protein n=1 Tax=Vibrio sp. Isolate32 TaxID=2908538 RepID=UPI001EFCBEB3|nr:hypothetical protein [Vibrio sp. Isolate32]MCG9553878.1 hypothetical protein [Vibrio sp. Isolate32]